MPQKSFVSNFFGGQFTTDGFTKIIRRKFFFLTIYSYLCNRQSGSLKWQNKVEYRNSLVSLSLPIFIDNQFNLLIIWCL